MTSHGNQRVAIVGAGPAGCALATFCARAGHDVTVFELNRQPQPVVGESLLPRGNRVIEKLGISMEGFIRKTGAVFVRDGRAVRFSFDEAERPEWTTAHQVPRAQFDARLRAVAAQAGARFRYEKTINAPMGYDWVVDATGRARVLGSGWTTYVGREALRNAAIARHVSARVQPRHAEPGDITIYALRGAWFWVIPLDRHNTSIGLVISPSRRGLKWNEALAECPELQEALAEHRGAATTSGYRDFTHYARRFSGDGWALVGDAALFLDPVFSSGVLMALESAERLSRVIDGQLEAARYEQQMRRAAALMEPLIIAFYNGDFLDLCMADPRRHVPAFRAGIVSLLSGDVFDDPPRMAKVLARRIGDFAARLRRDNEPHP